MLHEVLLAVPLTIFGAALMVVACGLSVPRTRFRVDEVLGPVLVVLNPKHELWRATVSFGSVLMTVGASIFCYQILRSFFDDPFRLALLHAMAILIALSASTFIADYFIAKRVLKLFGCA